MNAATLQRAMPGLPLGKARAYVEPLVAAMREAKITGRRRAAYFLAQLGHESVSLRYMEEIASGAAYEGRRDLGNVHPGDGRRYKGRGPIQLTGRNNYRTAGQALGLPLEAQPELAARPGVGFRVAAWFWRTRGLNELADRGDFAGVTRRINGGYNGLSDRRNRLAIVWRLGNAILPADPDPYARLPEHERKLAHRIEHHRAAARRARKGSEKERENAAYRELWKRRARAQLRQLQRDARAVHGGWSIDGRSWRYQLLERAVEGR